MGSTNIELIRRPNIPINKFLNHQQNKTNSLYDALSVTDRQKYVITFIT